MAFVYVLTLFLLVLTLYWYYLSTITPIYLLNTTQPRRRTFRTSKRTTCYNITGTNYVGQVTIGTTCEIHTVCYAVKKIFDAEGIPFNPEVKMINFSHYYVNKSGGVLEAVVPGDRTTCKMFIPGPDSSTIDYEAHFTVNKSFMSDYFKTFSRSTTVKKGGIFWTWETADYESHNRGYGHLTGANTPGNKGRGWR